MHSSTLRLRTARTMQPIPAYPLPFFYDSLSPFAKSISRLTISVKKSFKKPFKSFEEFLKQTAKGLTQTKLKL